MLQHNFFGVPALFLSDARVIIKYIYISSAVVGPVVVLVLCSPLFSSAKLDFHFCYQSL